MAFTHALSTNNYGPAKFIVSASAANGTHITIASALADATSGDTIFIRNGTYTENITLVAGVNLSAFTSDQLTPNVVILGTTTCTFVGTVTCTGIQFKTNSAACITSSGSNAAILNLYACYVNANNSTGITTTNANFVINCFGCFLQSASTFAIWALTNGALALNYSTTSSADTTASTVASTLNMFNCSIATSISTSSTGGLSAFNTTFNTGNAQTFITMAGTGTALVVNSTIQSLSSSAISVGAGTALTISNTVINSSNTNAITGAGTINFSNISFVGSSSKINTTTQVVQKSAAISMDSTSTTTGLTFDGTNFLKNYVEAGSWTPAITFGGGSTGITYTSRSGEYTRVGNMIFFAFNIIMSAKGSSTGIAAVSGLPVASAGTNAFMLVGYTLNITLAVGSSYVSMSPSASVLNLFIEALTGGVSNLTDVQFAATTQLQGNGFYFTS